MLVNEIKLWEGGVEFVAGVDEVGRGPLAGPVVAAAVIFPKDVFIPLVNDSKRLSSKRREELYPIIYERARSVGYGIVDNRKIDEVNILNATFLAMTQAVSNLSPQPHHILIDGTFFIEEHIPFTNIVHGDAKSFSIAAASIVAKVIRDALMKELDELYPKYGFARHKGYGTKGHIEAIRKHGLCEIHRRSFRTG
jgi:ribonuclease HII